jgi:hypothetical protein
LIIEDDDFDDEGFEEIFEEAERKDLTYSDDDLLNLIPWEDLTLEDRSYLYSKETVARIVDYRIAMKNRSGIYLIK